MADPESVRPEQAPDPPKVSTIWPNIKRGIKSAWITTATRFMSLAALRKVFIFLSIFAVPLEFAAAYWEQTRNMLTGAHGAIIWFAVGAVNATLLFWFCEELAEVSATIRCVTLVVFGILLILFVHREINLTIEGAEEAGMASELSDIRDFRARVQQILTIRLYSQLQKHGGASIVTVATASPALQPATRAPKGLPKEPPKQQSFPFVIPGVWMNGNSWDFIINHRGPDPSLNVEVMFVDRVKQKQVVEGKTSITNEDIASYMHLFKVGEVDAKGRGSIFAQQFLWTPPDPNHEEYEIMLTWRDGVVTQDLRIERVNDKWFYAIKIKDAESGNELMSCKDKGFPGAVHNETPCFPAILATH
jgi:hypothetical protein